jgi:hypothetical protein
MITWAVVWLMAKVIDKGEDPNALFLALAIIADIVIVSMIAGIFIK